jgi:hypothetical protein
VTIKRDNAVRNAWQLRRMLREMQSYQLPRAPMLLGYLAGNYVLALQWLKNNRRRSGRKTGATR